MTEGILPPGFDWRRLPRKSGAGRKPLAPGGTGRFTVTLDAATVAALRAIDNNLSAAIRKLVAAQVK